MSKARVKGTTYENRVVKFLVERGFSEAHREDFSSPLGDIRGVPGVVIECKNRATATFSEWLDQTKKSTAKTGYKMFCIFHNRRNHQTKDGYFTTSAEHGATLLRAWVWCEQNGVEL